MSQRRDAVESGFWPVFVMWNRTLDVSLTPLDESWEKVQSASRFGSGAFLMLGAASRTERRLLGGRTVRYLLESVA